MFDGNCLEAMTYYAKCLGGELTSMPFPPGPDGATINRKMHARLTKGAPILMASDTHPEMGFQQPAGFSIAIACESGEEIEKVFADLSAGGKVTMPLQDTFWGAHFGTQADKFGIEWMLNFDKPKA
jgi:PhnB protein